MFDSTTRVKSKYMKILQRGENVKILTMSRDQSESPSLPVLAPARMLNPAKAKDANARLVIFKDLQRNNFQVQTSCSFQKLKQKKGLTLKLSLDNQ